MTPFLSFMHTFVLRGLEAFGRYYSVYRAYVADVNDPSSLQRLKLVIPQVGDYNVYNYWAFPKHVFFGKGYGSQVLPQVGDVVWVEFEGGHPSKPVWSHGYPGAEEMPTEDSDLQDVHCYWFKTPKGHLIKLYDSKNILELLNANGTGYLSSDYGHSLFTDKKISLGSKEGSKEPAVLGNTAVDLLNEFINDIGNLDLIQTTSGVTGKISSSPKWAALVDKWNDKWKDFNSGKVNLD